MAKENALDSSKVIMSIQKIIIKYFLYFFQNI